jgi:hypothetical protein
MARHLLHAAAMRPAPRPPSSPLALLAALLLGCAGDDPPPRVYRAIGTVCTRASGHAVEFAVGFPYPCLDPCTTTVQACSATLEDGRIQLTTAMEVTGDTGASECPATCQNRSATCELQLPERASYRLIVDGGRSATLTLPPESPLALFGGACPPQP